MNPQKILESLADELEDEAEQTTAVASGKKPAAKKNDGCEDHNRGEDLERREDDNDCEEARDVWRGQSLPACGDRPCGSRCSGRPR